MSGFAILGFDKDPVFRFTAMLHAEKHFGALSTKFGVIKHPTIIGENIVCVKVQDFGAVFTPKEVYRLAKTVKRTDSMTKDARRFTDMLEGAANDALYQAETGQTRVI